MPLAASSAGASSYSARLPVSSAAYAVSVLRVEVILGIIASSIAILAFIARAWANIRRGRRVKRYADEISSTRDAEFRRLQEALQAAEGMTAQTRRKRERPE